MQERTLASNDIIDMNDIFADVEVGAGALTKPQRQNIWQQIVWSQLEVSLLSYLCLKL